MIQKEQTKPNCDSRKAAVKILNNIFENNTFATNDINRFLSLYNIADKRDIALIFELVNGVLEKNITIDYYISFYSKIKLNKIKPIILNILRVAIYQILYLDKIPDNAACDEAVKLCRKFKFEGLTGYVNGILRTIIRDEEHLPNPSDKTEALSVENNIPVFLIEKWIKDYGYDNCLKILNGFQSRTENIIRINNLKTDFSKMSDIYGENVKNIPFWDYAALFKIEKSLENDNYFNKGYFHVQNLSSQLCCKILDPQKNNNILDCCSAPGGKSFTIAEIIENSGQIDALDITDKKIDLIKDGAKRLGITNINVINKNAKEFTTDKIYDKILCDVPCSGFGLARKKPDIMRKTPEDIKELPEIQYDILKNSSKYLKTGGTLVYSTCTLIVEENNNIINRFLKENDNFEINKINIEANKKFDFINDNNMITVIPNELYEGFFIASIKRIK